ncbi:MAG: YihY family inner membrane protein [Cyanobacteria bacterium]|jgi:membrane protein|nr:YihY family inner membrane protein [Cyanobacteria bacterium GSL.Bin1]
MKKLKSLIALLRETFTQWLEHKAPRLAAALAYYMVFSLAPLLVIAIAIAGAIFGEEAARGEIVNRIGGFVGQDAASLIEKAISNASQPDLSNVASLISVAILLFGASGVFAQLQDALNTIWSVQPRPGRVIKQFISKRILSFGMVLGLGLFVILSLILTAAISALSQLELLPGFPFLWKFLSLAVSFGLVTLFFALVFKFLPDAKVAWSDVWIGSIITSILFAIGRSLLGWYLGKTSFASTYGAAGSLIVLLAWVYYSAQILFLGAEFTEVYARKFGSHITPTRHSRRITTTPLDED